MRSLQFSANLLRKVRVALSMTQEDFARAVGTKYRTYQKYEAGAVVPDANFVGRVASFCGFSTDDLYDTPPV